MKTVWKFPLEIRDEQTIDLPRDAVIVRFAAMKTGNACLWATVDPDEPVVPRTLYIRGTGHPLPEVPMLYLGTMFAGPFVWHVFQRMPI